MEFSNTLKELVWQRQKGMCGNCGKKFEELNDNVSNTFLPLINNSDLIAQGISEELSDEILMLCNMCGNDISGKDSPLSDIRKYSFQYANFSNYPYESIYNDVRQDILSQIDVIKDSSDFKESKNKIRELISIVRNVNLEREHREELQSAITLANDELQKHWSSEQEKNEKEFSEHYTVLKEKINEAAGLSESSQDIRIAREALIKAQNLFSEFKVKNEHRIELNGILQNAFEKLNHRQSEEWEKYEMECSENYYTLKEIVDSAISFSELSKEFKTAREKLIEVQNGIKGKRLKKDQRDSLYERIRGSFDNLNARQNEERAIFDKECEINYAAVIVNVNEGIEFSQTSLNFKDAREQLIDLQNQLKNLKLKKEQRDELFSKIRKSFDELNVRQSGEREVYETECNTNFNNISEKLEDIRTQIENFGNFNQIRDNLITIQGEHKILKLKKNQRTDLFNAIRSAFNALDSKRVEYRRIKNDDKLKKLGSILSNLENKVIRIEESITRDKEALEAQNLKLSEIREDTDEEYKIELKEKILAIEARIIDKEASLNDAKSRIQDIQFELSDSNKVG